jgi:hypothetical protein
MDEPARAALQASVEAMCATIPARARQPSAASTTP